MNSYYQTAFGLMQSALAKKAFLIGEEPEKLRDAYGRTSLGQGACWLAAWWKRDPLCHRLAWFQTWDHHANIFPSLSETFLPELDAAFAALH